MNKREKALLEIFRNLTRDAQVNLTEYAEFLLLRHRATPQTPGTPEAIPRPETETVIAAIKRLSQTYPMLNKDTMLHETSSLMAQHLLQGRDAVEVIDELEVIFHRQYDALIKVNQDTDNDA